jgi:alanine racemase
MINGFTAPSRYSRASNFQYSRDHEKGDETQGFAEIELDSIPEKDRRWAWIEIERNAIQHNVRATRNLLGDRTRLMAVVKADAYGHGAVEVAKLATTSGASYLGVATVDEGIQLRDAGLREPILLLSEPPAESVPLLLHNHIIPSVYTPDFAIHYAEIADAHNMKAPYHLAINSGMNRIGVRHDQVIEFISQVSFHRALDLQGCFTHFATADAAETLDFQIQINRFVESMRALEAAGINPGLVHCDNSAAIYRFPKTHFDMVRLGISLYGYHPANDTHRIVQLRPAMSVYARITNVIQVPMSEGVSYGMNYRSPGSVKICTVPVGYADGLIRLLSGQIKFAYQDRAVSQVGNICMDQCMFEVDIRTRAGHRTLDPQIGDIVQIAGPNAHIDTSIDTMAKRAGTIQHEVTIGFSHRMPRYYV